MSEWLIFFTASASTGLSELFKIVKTWSSSLCWWKCQASRASCGPREPSWGSRGCSRSQGGRGEGRDRWGEWVPPYSTSVGCRSSKSWGEGEFKLWPQDTYFIGYLRLTSREIIILESSTLIMYMLIVDSWCSCFLWWWWGWCWLGWWASWSDPRWWRCPDSAAPKQSTSHWLAVFRGSEENINWAKFHQQSCK